MTRRLSGKSFTIYCDNQSAIALACSNTYNARTKHIDVKHHFIKELLNDGKINLEYISSDKMIADYLTKAVSTNKQIFCTEAVALCRKHPEPYYGTRIGRFDTYAHNVKGTVYAVDDSTLFIKKFSYDGKADDAFFWIGNSPRPNPHGNIVSYPEDYRGE
ncbi:Electron transfer DM13 [Popillia japonica]|uniref:Electron transfer DM13 n=1 Tax=Popillia japonica TaxID=7064 RepID=A0AAW1HTJ8_POPJA